MVDMDCVEIVVSAAGSWNQLCGRFPRLLQQTFHSTDVLQPLSPGQDTPKALSFVCYGKLGTGLKPFPPDRDVAAVAARCVVGKLVPQLSFVLQCDIPKSSLIGNDSHCQGKEPKQQEQAIHFPRQENRDELGIQQ